MGKWKALAAALLVAAVAGCGGGGGSSGATTGGGGGSNSGGSTDGGGSTPASNKLASFVYQLSKSSLSTTGSDSALLTITALDSNNNPVPGVTATVAVDSGIYTPVSSLTDDKGQVSGNITIGANKANRNITATMKLGSKSATAALAVAGSQVSVTPLPATASPGAPVRADIKVTDANGAGVPSVPVQLAGTLGFTGSVTTDLAGNASANLTAAPSVSGTYTIDVTALGSMVTRSVQVVAAGGAGIPDVTDVISSASLAVVPNTISPNAMGSTANRAALKAKFLNASNQAISNVRVRFEIVPPALGSGEQISTGTSTVYSDTNGEAIGDYIAGTRSSPTNGVTIRACYGATDASIAGGACPNSVTNTLTVASQPLSITLGDNNLLEKGNQNLTYIKKFDVAVADAAGNPVAGAVISASVDLVEYGKGRVDKTTTPVSAVRLWCPNEDKNRNGSLDSGEDVNHNGTLDPRKADIILSFVGSNVTSSTGRALIQVEYAQNYAVWLNYTVKVTTSVAGSEGTVARTFITDFIKGDEDNGSFLVSPYGLNVDSTPLAPSGIAAGCVDPS